MPQERWLCARSGEGEKEGGKGKGPEEGGELRGGRRGQGWGDAGESESSSSGTRERMVSSARALDHRENLNMPHILQVRVGY